MLRLRTLAALTAALALLAACGGDDGDDAATDGGEALVGLFAIDPGLCDGATPTGSHFRMVQPGGDVEAGPFMTNADSTCADQTVTALAPGADGGLRTGAYQAQTEPPFDPEGSSTAAAVIAPTPFFAVGFGVSTNEVDPQSEKAVDPPTLRAADGALAGDLSSVSVSWNGQHFNQGAPKPDASGNGPSGTYDADTGAYSLDWTSRIDGGPFDGFTGIWHFEGTFTP